jgi:K+/H+ antiporter YhaU regulatory subunit KhtT
LIEADRVKRTNPEADTMLNEGATLVLAGDRRTISQLKKLLINGEV